MSAPKPVAKVETPKPAPVETAWENFMRQAKVFAIQLAAGGGAGTISKTAVAPLERVKVILQVQAVANVPQDKRYKGIMDALVRIPKEQGFMSLWRGNGANVIRIIPSAAIKFTMYDRYKQLIFPKGERAYHGFDKLWRKFAAGGLSGATTQTITYPMDLARTRMTADVGKVKQYNGLFDCMIKTCKQEGFFGLYKGFGISLAGIVPYLATSFACYDTFNGMLPTDEKSVKSLWYPWAKLATGSAAGIVSQTLTYPMDTIRRRMQMNGSGGKAKKYTSSMDCAKKMLKEEGIKSMYKGCLANAIKGAPGSAIQFVCYDYLKDAIYRMAKVDAKMMKGAMEFKSD